MFIISREQAHNSKLYAHADKDGDIGWVPNKARATRFDEPVADNVAAEFSKYSLDEVSVEGVKDAA